MYKRILYLFLTISLLAGCSNGIKKIGPKTKETQNDRYYFNETFEIEDVEIKITKKEPSQKYHTLHAKQGDEFLIFHIFVKNNQKGRISVSPSEFNVSSKTNKITGAFKAEENEKLLHYTVLKAGQSLKGTIVFEVPKEEPYNELTYVPSFVKKRKATIQFE